MATPFHNNVTWTIVRYVYKGLRFAVCILRRLLSVTIEMSNIQHQTSAEPAMHKDYILIESNVLKQLHFTLEIPSINDVVLIQDVMSCLDNHQESPGTTGNSQSRASSKNHTCLSCGRTFAKRVNCGRHLAIIHGLDMFGNPIDDVTLQRYKHYNRRRAQMCPTFNTSNHRGRQQMTDGPKRNEHIKECMSSVGSNRKLATNVCPAPKSSRRTC